MMNCPHCNVHIDEHPASRCLDAWVAEAVMSEKPFQPKKYSSHDYGDKWFLEAPYPNYPGKPMPIYSTSIAAAWEVVEKLNNWNVDDNMLNLRGQGPEGFDEGVGWWDADIGGARGHFSAKADTAPLAICRAAIKASE